MYMYSFLSCIARNKQVLIHLCIAITNHLWHRNYHCSLKNVSIVVTEALRLSHRRAASPALASSAACCLHNLYTSCTLVPTGAVLDAARAAPALFERAHGEGPEENQVHRADGECDSLFHRSLQASSGTKMGNATFKSAITSLHQWTGRPRET